MSSAEEFHVVLDFQSQTPDLSQPYQLIGLETATPLLRISKDVYKGKWATPIGTEMVFDDKGQYVTSAEKRIIFTQVEVRKKGENAGGKPARAAFVRKKSQQPIQGTQ